MKLANKDKVMGAAQNIKGKLTDNPLEEYKGKARNALGNVKDQADDLSKQAKSKASNLKVNLQNDPRVNEKTLKNGALLLAGGLVLSYLGYKLLTK